MLFFSKSAPTRFLFIPKSLFLLVVQIFVKMLVWKVNIFHSYQNFLKNNEN